MPSGKTSINTTKLRRVESEKVEQLEARMRGYLIRPNDDAYDEARAVWNGMIDRRPALIARCAGTADVISAVNFAREHEMPTSVRGGGHNVAGNAVCDDGLATTCRAGGVSLLPDVPQAPISAFS